MQFNTKTYYCSLSYKSMYLTIYHPYEPGIDVEEELNHDIVFKL